MFGKRKDAISVVDELLDAQQLRSLYYAPACCGPGSYSKGS